MRRTTSSRSRSARSCSRSTSTATAHEQRRAPARLRLAQLPARALQALAPRQPRADRRCRAHGALLASAPAPSSRWRTRSRSSRRRRRGGRPAALAAYQEERETEA
jgi:hypothetical protein